MLFWIIIGSVVALALLMLLADPAPRVRKQSGASRMEPVPVDESDDPLDLLARDAPTALLRYGTPEDVEYLRQSGRADELRGLGYRGPVE